jgi:replicative DNA helicase
MSIKLFDGAHPIKRVSEKDTIKKAIQKIIDVSKGNIKPLRTSWPKFNDAFVNGIEWRTITVVGARPGVGKTLFMEQLTSDIVELNRDQDFRILKFQLEMVDETDGVRKLSVKSGLSYEILMSKYEKLGREKIKSLIDIYDSIDDEGRANVIYDPCTVNEMCASIHDECERYKRIVVDDDGEREVYTNILVCIDHSALLKKDKGEKDKFEMLNNLGEAMTFMKKKYPVSFLILSQLNRGSDSPERNKPGTYGNYILDSDIYGSDALLQHADIVIGINRPFDRRINVYGPDRLIINDENLLVFHFLKSRNGTTRIGFYTLDRSTMRFIELDRPPESEIVNNKV